MSPLAFVVLVVVVMAPAGCSDDGPQGAGAAGGTSAGGASPGGSSPTGGDGGVGATGGSGEGGATGGSGEGGNGGDLGWPFDDSVPEPCPPTALGEGGAAWAGWVNLQYPPSLEGAVGLPTEAIYGQTYQAGVTSAPGASSGWESEIGLGPWGTLPIAEARCWSFVPGSFNTDVGNNDEYTASVVPSREGLFGLVHRARPPGGQWRYGDLDGSDDGLSAGELSLLEVASSSEAPLVVATLNLRCRLDDWAARRPLVVRALARLTPDLVALQEDCLAPDGTSQSEEVSRLLSAHTGRGYQIHRETTHVASSGNESFPEGIAVMSAHRLEAVGVLELPYENFPRKAIGVDVTVRGRPLRFYSTHFDYGPGNESVRAQSAETILQDLPPGRPSIVAGDLNAEPGEGGPAELAAELSDLWVMANPSSPGLTMPASAPSRRIDFIFATPSVDPPSLAPLGAKLLDEQEAGVLLSDHLGVAAALER